MEKENKLEIYRAEIVVIDEKIFKLLEQRFAVVEKIGQYKKANNLPMKNVQREQLLIEKMQQKIAFNKKFIEKFYKLLFNHSYAIEK